MPETPASERNLKDDRAREGRRQLVAVVFAKGAWPMVEQAGDLDPDVIAKRVEEIWKDVLDMPEGRRDLTFFDLQGQSISAVRITARVEDELGVPVDVGILFEDPDLDRFTSAVLAAATTPVA
ncbi:phosphopantetheine-binding protein [Dactylosporangium sp. NPDC049140]|uniref:phosphopantetheine-binding protein n=2 Tax=unclassified Dactylosporangium TaxID=2621675 RepID=UPI0033DE6D6E